MCVLRAGTAGLVTDAGRTLGSRSHSVTTGNTERREGMLMSGTHVYGGILMSQHRAKG